MNLNRRTRQILGLAGAALMLLAIATWVLPLVFSPNAVVTEKVEVTTGSRKTTEETLGWGAVHSDQILILLLASGVVLLALGALPPGSIKVLKTPFGDVELTARMVGQLAAATTAAKVPAKKVEGVIVEALGELATAAEVSQGKTFRPSQDQIDEAVARAIEEDDD